MSAGWRVRASARRKMEMNSCRKIFTATGVRGVRGVLGAGWGWVGLGGMGWGSWVGVGLEYVSAWSGECRQGGGDAPCTRHTSSAMRANAK